MKSLSVLATVALGAALPATAVTVLPLADANFDASPNSAWTPFGNAFPDEPAPGIDPGLEGTQTLKMFGNFTGGQNFTGAFQDIAVDGTILKVGDPIQLTGFLAHVTGDSLASPNVAFLELTWVDTDIGGLGEFGFGANASAPLDSSSPLDTWIAAATPVPSVPVEAEFVRVKAVFIQDQNAGGAAWVDDLELTIIPEPSSALLLGLSGLALLRRRRG